MMKDEYELPAWYNDPEVKQYLFKVHAKCNIEQYWLLKRCSEKKDIFEWNIWRVTNPDVKIYLQGANFWEANLQGAYLFKAHLQGAFLMGARLQHVHLFKAHLQCAYLFEANLQGTNLTSADLRGANFTAASVDGQTLIATRYIDKDTNFSGVGLNSACLKPGLKQTLQYNIRRKRWEEWYKKGNWPVRFLKRLVIQSFWWVSDYGRSTGRIILTFFLTAFIFAGIYYLCGLVKPPGIIENLFVVEPGKVNVPPYIVPLRAIYFSIVTMTTLGFGDIYANPKSIAGHLCLIVQVILGYAFLAALVTRLAVLFTADGPAVDFWRKRGKIKECWIRIRWCARRAKRRLFQSYRKSAC